MAIFKYTVNLGWPYDVEILDKLLGKYSKKNNLVLERNYTEFDYTFELHGEDSKIEKIEALRNNEESLMAELVGI